jgi:hypothetical protein
MICGVGDYVGKLAVSHSVQSGLDFQDSNWTFPTKVYFTLFFYLFIIAVLGVHCDICKNSYNIS